LGSSKYVRQTNSPSVSFHQEILSAEFAKRGTVGPQGNRSRFCGRGVGLFSFLASIEPTPFCGRSVYILRSDARVVRAEGMRDQDESLKPQQNEDEENLTQSRKGAKVKRRTDYFHRRSQRSEDQTRKNPKRR
jgi:hypothetical protein